MRTEFVYELEQIERGALGGIDLAVEALDAALGALASHDVERAGGAVSTSDQLHAHCHDTQDAIMSLMARQAPVARDLRLVLALIDANRRIERVGAQCATIATKAGHHLPECGLDSQLLHDLTLMGRLVHEQLELAKHAFVATDVVLAAQLPGSDTQIDRLQAQVLRRAVEIGTTEERRRWAIDMVLVARCLERAGDNAVGIARHAAFVAGRRTDRPEPIGS